jgi:penicillin-binding protein 1A
VGGFDFYASRFNRTLQAKRQPGSSFKPFVYSGALEHGFTAASIVLDAPIVIDSTAGGDAWRPENDSKRFYGPTRLRDALAHSRNLVSIRVLRALGVDYALDYAARFGFDPQALPHNLTLALGTAQLSPLEVARGYATFANGGFRVTPYLVQRVDAPGGRTVMAADPPVACLECELPLEPALDPAGQTPTTTVAGDETTHDRLVSASEANAHGSAESQSLNAVSGTNAAGVTHLSDLGLKQGLPKPRHLAPHEISTANAFIMTDLMRDVIRKGTGRRALVLKRDDIAGKTGTTNDRRDTWFTGFNADIVAGAWVGFDQERSLGANEEGGHTALPMWVYFMGKALGGRPDRRLAQPEGVISARILPTTGELAHGNEPDALFEYFLAGRLPGTDGLPDATTNPAGPRRPRPANDAIF